MGVESAQDLRKKAVSEASTGLDGVLAQINERPFAGQWRVLFSQESTMEPGVLTRALALVEAINEQPHLSAQLNDEIEATYIIVQRGEAYYLERQDEILEPLNDSIRKEPFAGKWRLNIPDVREEPSQLVQQLKCAIEKSGEYTATFNLVGEGHRAPHFIVVEKT